MDWSFQLYSARDFQPWDKVLRTIAKDGYKQVEGFGGVYADPAAFRAELDKNGLTMPTAHFPIHMLEGDFATADKIARALGVETMICPHIAAEERPDDAAGWRAFGGRLANVGKTAKAAGYGFAWHNHDFEFVKLPDGSVPQEIILDVAPDIGWEFDIAWFYRGGDTNPWPWFKKYGQRLVAIHVKDIAKPGEGLDEDGWADVGHGTIDWKKIIETVRTETSTRYFVIEQDKPNDFERFSRRSIAAAKTY